MNPPFMVSIYCKTFLNSPPLKFLSNEHRHVYWQMYSAIFLHYVFLFHKMIDVTMPQKAMPAKAIVAITSQSGLLLPLPLLAGVGRGSSLGGGV